MIKIIIKINIKIGMQNYFFFINLNSFEINKIYFKLIFIMIIGYYFFDIMDIKCY